MERVQPVFSTRVKGTCLAPMEKCAQHTGVKHLYLGEVVYQLECVVASGRTKKCNDILIQNFGVASTDHEAKFIDGHVPLLIHESNSKVCAITLTILETE